MADTDPIKKILFITLSNLGDAVLGLPAFDFLKRQCPQARITVIASPRTRVLFERHPDVDRLLVFDKAGALRGKIDLFHQLNREGFDVVVDLKNTFYRWGVKARHKNPAWLRFPAWVEHASEEHLYKAVVALKGPAVTREDLEEHNCRRNPSFISAKDNQAVDALLGRHGVRPQDDFVLLVPGARSDLKRWSREGYAEVIQSLRQAYHLPVIVTGEEAERPFIREILSLSAETVIDLCGQLSFGGLAALVARAKLVVCNDSGVVHLASYLNRPVVGIYGPTNYRRYGPWSPRGIAVRRDVLCAPCGRARCRYDRPTCVSTIRPYDVLLAVRLALENEEPDPPERRYRRILVARSDRIGDVLISTPVLKALRDHYPSSFIAMMVAASNRELVEGNPYLDQVILLDKDAKHRGLWGTLALSRLIRRSRFDVAVILHPTARVHLICFLAGIRERIGYDRKAPFLLTQAIPHRKQEGLKHEMEYNADLLRPLGIVELPRQLTLPANPAADRKVDELLRQKGVGGRDLLVALSPTSSGPPRNWPVAKFAALADRLSLIPGVKVCVVAHADHRPVTRQMIELATAPVMDLTGAFTLSELGGFFKRCRLVISNISGPAHLSVAVGTPVISVFGGNQPGLSPTRWRPLGPRDVAVHHKTDCPVCHAHNCARGFACLEAITVEEVLGHAERLLGLKVKESR